MYELIPLANRTFLIQASTNVGVYVRGDRAYMIDSGLNRRDAAQFLNILDAHGWKLDAIFNTHYHSDHIGGNRYLQEKTGCRCYCPLSFFAAEPLINTVCMTGAYPAPPIMTDVFLAEASVTEELTPEVLPEGFAITSLPGHSYAQCAIRTPDDVLFMGDVVLGYEELAKNSLFYVYSYNQHLESLEKARAMHARCYVPSHGGYVTQLDPLIQANVESFQTMHDWILEFCAGEGMSQDELLKAIFDRFQRHLHLALYTLCACALHAHLAALIEEGKIVARAKGNFLRYRAARRPIQPKAD